MSYVNVSAFLIAVVTLAAIVVDYGFLLDEGERRAVAAVCNLALSAFTAIFLFRIFFYFNSLKGRYLLLTLVLAVGLFLRMLPILYPASQAAVVVFADSKFYNVALLVLFSLPEISRGVIGFIDKRTNPALLMAVCFLVIILLGALLLLLPRSTNEWVRLPVVDAFFVSTSAVCVTGLSTVDIAQIFSFEGQCIILLLIQVGGLGVMTITSFFVLFFMGGTVLYNQFALRDMIGSDTFSSLISVLLYIMGFTFVIELVGAFLLWLSVHGTLGLSLREELFFSLFHAVSAFCNAGFSTLSGNLGNVTVLHGHNAFYITLSLLVILGGIGFPILVNLRGLCIYYLSPLVDRLLRRKRVRHHYRHITNVNTKIVLGTTLLLLVGGTLFIALFEWNGAFGSMPYADRVVHAFFNAAVPRTAGFNSVQLEQFSLLSLLVYIFLMWVGGGSQSTAGGIKVNTLAVAYANFLSIVRGRDAAVLFNREIGTLSVRRAMAVLFGSVAVISLFSLLLVAVEPGLPAGHLLFETVSAYSTVGASLGVTPLLGNVGKIIVIVLMFVGRVGLVTVLMAFAGSGGALKYRLPEDDVIIS